MELGEKLKEARVNAGLKQEELAKQLGVSRQTISNWENNRSLPDVGSAVKMSNVYQVSLDELLRDERSVLKTFEDLVTRRRKFWQMMLEIGIILDLLSTLLVVQEMVGIAIVCRIAGISLEYLSIFMHLRVFDHDWGEILRGTIGLVLHMGCNILLRFTMSALGISFLRLLSFGLIWSADVLTIDLKSTRLWLIIVLFFGTPLLNIGTTVQELGGFNSADPFGQSYQIAQVLHPEGGSVPEYTKVELAGTYMYVSDRNGDRTGSYGPFTYVEPIPGQSQKGTWSLIPEDAPEGMFQITVEADDSILLSYYRQDQLCWRGKLTPYGRNTCVVDVSTFGKSIYFQPDWYAPGREDPQPTFSLVDVVDNAKMKLTVAGLPQENLTLYEEYHHGDRVETAVYSLEPVKPHRYEMKLATRYDGEEEWALYRIPFEDGDYRFILVFG
ncbi:MAG: helix-turn-helix transcriptional regulator [Oscillospiraceae bacterium]|nr:helix-turn-helix transcriptional regulator [Oscillospiraceae bacterium]